MKLIEKMAREANAKHIGDPFDPVECPDYQACHFEEAFIAGFKAAREMAYKRLLNISDASWKVNSNASKVIEGTADLVLIVGEEEV